MENKKIYSLRESRNTLNSISKDLHAYEQATGLRETGLCVIQSLNNRFGICASQNRRFSR